jgi:tetratricopeptide (TPR) repeat protein
LGNNSADQFFPRSVNSSEGATDETHRRFSRSKMPSSAGYMLAALITAVALFFMLWWMLVSGGDEAPWLPAGLAASVVLLVAVSAREVVMRRAWTRYLLEHGIQQRSSRHRSSSSKKGYPSALHSAALREIQKQSAAADATSSQPEAHLEVAQLCQEYLAGTDEALHSGNQGHEKRIALKAGQERVRSLHKHHLLTWARGQARSLTREAQQRARTYDKIETANKALECIDSALRVYPDESELYDSKAAIGEFVVSVKVAHWVELAERAAFKRQYRRAIDRYRDALFYLNNQIVKDEVRAAGKERIELEIAKLKTKIRSGNGDAKRPVAEDTPGRSEDI